MSLNGFKKLKFEYSITLAYLFIGILWIVFSDKLLHSIISDIDILSEVQTFKGWFYVLITALLFFLFIKKHLSKLRSTELELANHKNNLEKLVSEKTQDLDAAITELSTANKMLNDKNEIINTQNTELKKTLQDLKETQAQLFQADKMASIGILTAGIAHEINNPLNFIMGAYEGIKSAYDQSSKQVPDENIEVLLDALNTGIERATNIVKSLNEFSRDSKNNEEQCNIHTIMNNCLVMLNNSIKDNIKIEKEYSNEEIIIKGNVGQLHQVFLNVLSNAVHAIKKTGDIKILTKIADHEAIISISDTGAGIASENLTKITDPFFTTKEPGKGTGLGLYITYNIVKDHKGSIKFNSEPEKGTTVIMKFPVHKEDI